MPEILILGPAFPLRGGIANFNEALCKAFISEGISCSIISFTKQYPEFLFPGKTQIAEGDTPPEGITILPLVNSINPFTWRRTAKYISEQRPKLLIVRYWMPFMAPCLGSILRKVKKADSKIRILAIADNIIPHEHRAGDQLLTSYFVKACDAFIVMSKSVMNDLRMFDKQKPIKLQPHPVYDIFGNAVTKTEARNTLKLGSGNLILFFGFIRKYKGLDLLIRAMSDDRLRRTDVRLIVAGEFYENKKPYLDLVSELGLEDRIIFHDHYIPKETVKNYFCSADLVVQPYRDATQSGVTQIAYHFGIPMVVTNVGGLAEIVPDGKAGYVTEVNPTAIATAIADFFMNHRSGKMEQGVKESAKQLSWENFAKGVLEFSK